MALQAFLLLHRQPQGLKKLVFVIQDVVLRELHQLVKGGLCVCEFLGSIWGFGAINVHVALLQLLRASLHTWRQQKDLLYTEGCNDLLLYLSPWPAPPTWVLTLVRKPHTHGRPRTRAPMHTHAHMCTPPPSPEERCSLPILGPP